MSHYPIFTWTLIYTAKVEPPPSAPFPETVRGWYQPLADPIRVKWRSPIPDQAYEPTIITATGTANIFWYQPLSAVMVRDVMIGSG